MNDDKRYVLFNVHASVVEGRPLFLYGIGENGKHIYDALGSALRYVQTGDAQAYAAVMALALLGGAVYALIQVLQ